MTARIDRFDRDWSRFRVDSLVHRIAEAPGRYRMPPDAPALLDLYRELYDATAGRVSPLVARQLERLGYGATPALRLAAEHPVPPWDDVLSWDGERLETTTAALLDVGAAGKGYLVDLVCELLREASVSEFLVDASGDLRGRGELGLRIALEHPGDPRRAVGVAEPGARALCASATNRRRWADVTHHVLDAVTGLPTPHVVATWAIADTALVADGAATALFFDVEPDFLQRHRVEHVRLFADGRFDVSADFPGELFL